MTVWSRWPACTRLKSRSSVGGLSVVSDFVGNDRIVKINGASMLIVESIGPVADSDENDDSFWFDAPRDVFADAGGNLLIVDGGTPRVVFRSSTNDVTYIDTWLVSEAVQYPNTPAVYGSLKAPVSVTAFGSTLFVSDAILDQVLLFDLDPAPDPDPDPETEPLDVLIGTLGGTGTGNDNLRFPTGIALDNAGKLYVCDSQHNVVKRFKQGTDGWYCEVTFGEGEVTFPAGVAVSRSDEDQPIYVADARNHAARKYAPEPYAQAIVHIYDDAIAIAAPTLDDFTFRKLDATDAETTVYHYDANGNRDWKQVGSNLKTVYEYDTFNRLIAADTNNDGMDDFTATYDYRTRRLLKTEGSDTTYFRYDGGVSFQEWKNGAKEVEFVRGSGMGGGIGSILYSERGTDPLEYFVYSPAVGHVTATVTGGSDTAAATIKSTNVYEAFGQVMSYDIATGWSIAPPGQPTSGQSDNNRLANTKERDVGLGLDCHGFRFYDPEIGRYLTRDPIGYASGTLNVYEAVGNNPGNTIDPLGLTVEVEGDKCRNELNRLRLAQTDIARAKTEKERDRIAEERGVDRSALDAQIGEHAAAWEDIREWNERVHADLDAIGASGSMGNSLVSELMGSKKHLVIRRDRKFAQSGFGAAQDDWPDLTRTADATVYVPDRLKPAMTAEYGRWGAKNKDILRLGLSHELVHAADWFSTDGSAEAEQYFSYARSGKYVSHTPSGGLHAGGTLREQRAVAATNQIAKDMGSNYRRLDYTTDDGVTRYNPTIATPHLRNMRDLQHRIPFAAPRPSAGISNVEVK